MGVYHDTYQSYQAVLTWSLDFTSDTEGEMFLEVTVAGQQQPNNTIPFTYTFDGTSGMINAGSVGMAPFTYNAADTTITMVLQVGVEQDGSSLGGETVFYMRGTGHDPDDGGETPEDDGVEPGEVTTEFPAGSSWTCSEESIYPVEGVGEIPITLHYELVFNNDHTANLNVVVSALGSYGDPQTVRFNWTFDNSTQAGTLITKGTPLPYHYNPEDDTMETEFNFNVGEGGGTAGGHLIFTRSGAKMFKVMLG